MGGAGAYSQAAQPADCWSPAAEGQTGTAHGHVEQLLRQNTAEHTHTCDAGC